MPLANVKNSEESKRVVETTISGQEISHLNLSSIFPGQSRNIPQPEGITMDNQGHLYICSEPNLLYIYAKNKSLPEDRINNYNNHNSGILIQNNLLKNETI